MLARTAMQSSRVEGRTDQAEASGSRVVTEDCISYSQRQ